nr:MAG: hypothetical protein [Helarchaeota virus Nidhogg Meg22_1012]
MYSMKKYGGRVNFVLHKRGGDFEPSFMEDVGYYDFFTMEVVSNVSESCVSLSFLPWKELEGLFHYDVVEEDDDED